ncbi:hypothetical protein E308F_29850 [Moorella sp. E308F]|uniref:hypothetical protein n=1 Tax=Moorella sp. E308F TaxID=2572682 RepID=UPI0010FFC6E9|nr:hypothetical protein [Moorella sp. E308F]GEA16739.1 hypothetical protein E308F_29850 [Moorella sp. E308F]
MSKPTYEELEAQCAAMREALEQALPYFKLQNNGEKIKWPWVVKENILRVLSNDVGKALLERMAKLEAVVEAAKEAKNVIKMLHPIMDEDEPCIVYEVYTELTKTLSELEEEEKDV